ncbi:MAG: PilZ domain-containing protein [Deltaproteobacteria bacterium]|nr:PilZ domain-containing protein [Deltaproteobacteria bacterium]
MIERRSTYGAWVEEMDAGTPDFFLSQSLGPEEMHLLAEEPPSVGREVQLRLVVENERRVVDLSAQVVGHEPSAEGGKGTFAVRFTELDPEERAFLISLFEESGKA